MSPVSLPIPCLDILQFPKRSNQFDIQNVESDYAHLTAQNVRLFFLLPFEKRRNDTVDRSTASALAEITLTVIHSQLIYSQPGQR